MRVVSPEERDCYFYSKSIRALSKLSFERLAAMCWTWLQISGKPVFKTPGRYTYTVVLTEKLLFTIKGVPPGKKRII